MEADDWPDREWPLRATRPRSDQSRACGAELQEPRLFLGALADEITLASRANYVAAGNSEGSAARALTCLNELLIVVVLAVRWSDLDAEGFGPLTRLELSAGRPLAEKELSGP